MNKERMDALIEVPLKDMWGTIYTCHEALVLAYAERDEAREMLRGIRECIDLFQHDTMFDLKGHLLAILEGDTE